MNSSMKFVTAHNDIVSIHHQLDLSSWYLSSSSGVSHYFGASSGGWLAINGRSPFKRLPTNMICLLLYEILISSIHDIVQFELYNFLGINLLAICKILVANTVVILMCASMIELCKNFTHIKHFYHTGTELHVAKMNSYIISMTVRIPTIVTTYEKLNKTEVLASS